MEFCTKCGGLIIVKEEKAACASCGLKLKKKPKIQASEKIEKHNVVSVIKEDDTTLPIIDMKCEKCKNKKSYFWTQQTRSSDEDETKFYKCVKCKHTWRVYR
tara:strand:+ start:2164 stop:2469 length:306 start_codon:yes stop_codon:yes gene_type:complete